jgi:hypothetical protein
MKMPSMREMDQAAVPRADVVTFTVKLDLDRFDYRALSSHDNIVYLALRKAFGRDEQPVRDLTAERMQSALRGISAAQLAVEDFDRALPAMRKTGAVGTVVFGARNEHGGFTYPVPYGFLGEPVRD